MKVGIIGAGFTGLAAALELANKGHDVEILERSDRAGGLALGFGRKNWKWGLEEHYHHWFTNDRHALELAQQINHKVITTRPKTSFLYKDKYYQFDSASSLLAFPALSLFSKLRVGATLLFLKLTPVWRPLERISASRFAVSTMGNEAWSLLWKPLFKGKFGPYSNRIAASWFWARIKKRTPALSYPYGGFQHFADRLAKKLEVKGVKIYFKKEAREVRKSRNKISVKVSDGATLSYDKLIITLPFPLVTKVVKNLPRQYSKKANSFKGIGAITMVAVLKDKFLSDGTYWLNINDRKFPFLAVVEHTNFVDKKNYGGEHILYIGNYIPTSHDYFRLSDKELLKTFAPYLKRINSNFSMNWVKRIDVFRAPFAQPIVGKNYSKKILPFVSPIPNVYIANIQQVYPWDRGTNYAIELGKNVAIRLHEDA